MAFHVVGAVAVKVRPDTTKFREEAQAELKKAARNLEAEVDLVPGGVDNAAFKAKAKSAAAGAKIEIPVELDEDALDAAALTRRIKEVNRKVASSGGARIDINVNHAAAMAKIKTTLRDAQHEADQSPLNLKYITSLRAKELTRQLQKDLDKERLRIKAVADFDSAGFLRDVQRLQRDSKLTLKPDVDKTFAELEGTELMLKANIDLKRDRIQKSLDEVTKLTPLLLSTDPSINTTEVRDKWAKLKAQLEADKVDLKFDQKRLVEVQGLMKNVDVDSVGIRRSIDKLFRDLHTTINPDVKLDVRKLRDLDAKLQVDIEFKKAELQRKLEQLNRLKPAVLDVNPEVNTPEIRAQFEKLKKEIEADTVELKADFDRRSRIAPLIAPVRVDESSITGAMSSANRLLAASTAALEPTLRFKRAELDKLRQETVDLEASVQIRREAVQDTLRKMTALRPFVLSTDPEINTKQVREEWDRLKKKLSGDTVELKADLDRQGRVRTQLAELTRNRYVDLIVRIRQRSLTTAKATLAALTGVNTLRSASLWLERIGTNIDTYALKLAKWSTLLLNLSNVVGSATATLITFGAQLGKLGGFALGIPAALGAATAAFVVGKMAFEGFGDAIDGNIDALDKLPPAARATARELQGVWASIQKPVQAAFWEGLGTSMTTFVRTSLPQIRAGLTEVAGAMGRFLDHGLQGLTDFARKGLFGDLLSQLGQGIRNAAPAAFSLADAFVTIGDAGARYFPRIGTYIADIADQFDRWIRKAEVAGKLTQWMDNARETARKLWDGLKDITSIFGGLADAARGAGAGGIDAFASKMAEIRKTVEGPIFQATMRNLFTGAREGAQGLYSALGPLGDMLYELGPTLRNVFRSVGETVGNTLTTIANAMSGRAFAGGLADLFNGISRGMEGLNQRLPGVVDGLGSLGSLLGSVFEQVLPAVGRGFEIISGAFQEIQPSLKELAPSLGSLVQDGLSVLAGVLPLITGPIGLLVDAFVSLPEPVRQAVTAFLLFRPLASGLIGIVGNLFTAVRNLGSGTGMGALAGLKSMLATGFVTAGLVAVAQGFRAIGEDADYAKSAAKSALEAARAIQQGQVDNPFNPLGNEQTQQAALAKAEEFGRKIFEQTGRQFDKQSLMDIVLGVDSPGAQRARSDLQGLMSQADEFDGNGFSRFMESALSFGNSKASSNWNQFGSDIKSFLDVAPEVNNLNMSQWETEAGRIEAVNSLASASLEKFGRITSQNVPEIARSLDGQRFHLRGYGAEAEIMAKALGGTSDEIGVNSRKLNDALKIYGDSPRGIARAATELGLSGREIQTIMSAVGISAEEAGEAAKFGFGSVADAMGLTTSALAQNTPLLYKGSSGITELSRALSEATGVNANLLGNVMISTGHSAAEMANALAGAGVPITSIRDVLGSMGYPAQEAADALSGVAQAAQEASSDSSWNSSAALDFQGAMQGIARAGGDAAAQADALRLAIDRLNGGVIESDRLIAALNSAVVQSQEAFSLTDAEINEMGASWKGWGAVVDDVTGQIDTATLAGQDLFKSVDSLGREAMATANDAFDKNYAKTGDLVSAQQAAKDAIDDAIKSFDDQARAANLTDEEVAKLKDRYQLWPDEIVTTITAESLDAERKLGGVLGLIAQMKPGVKANIGVVDNGALQKLKDMGVELRQLADGTWEATLSADPATAKQQVQDFALWASTQTVKTNVEVNQDRAKAALQQFLDLIGTKEGRVWLAANPDRAQQALGQYLGIVNKSTGTTTIGANTQPAAQATMSLGQWIGSIWANITTGNNTSPAQGSATGLVSWIRSLWGNVNTGASTSGATSTVSWLLGYIRSQSANLSVGATIASSVYSAISYVQRAVSNLLGRADGGIDKFFPDGRHVQMFANGGFYRTGFNGGKERHTAFITKKLRVFGEPETKGEAYIPLAMAKRAQSTRILNEVARRFGMETVPKDQARVRKYADGGIDSSASALPGASDTNITIIQNNPVAEKDTTAVRRAAQFLTARG